MEGSVKYFSKYHPKSGVHTHKYDLLTFPMSTDKVTETVKTLLKKYKFSDKIQPQISSSLKDWDKHKIINEQIEFSLRESGSDCDETKMKIILNGVRVNKDNVEYTIGAAINTPSDCSIFKEITIKTTRDIEYYINSLLRKLKNK